VPAPIAYNFWAINGAQAAFGSGKGAVMDWARLLAYVTGTVDQELLARTERKPHLTAKAQLKGRLGLAPVSWRGDGFGSGYISTGRKLARGNLQRRL